MPSELALFLCISAMGWLFFKDRTLRPMTSGSLWIVLVWVMIVGSRAISTWTVSEYDPDRTPAAYLEGSPLDRNVLLLLIISGVIALIRRRVPWDKVLDSNPWFFAFLIYCGLSIFWSDFPFVSLKRWIKELGNVVMVLILVTERDPVQAIKAVFARYAYFAIPLSAVLIKYFGNLGRYYGVWTGEPVYSGVATEKNSLGILLFTCGLFLLWDLMEKGTRFRDMDKADLVSRLILLSMVGWLFLKANSITPLVCLVLGACLLLFTRHPGARKHLRHLGSYSLLAISLLSILYLFPASLEPLMHMLGREATLTGRTEIWADVLKEPINPFLGTGYQSFWLGPGGIRMWDKYYFHPTQAHNGFLETYLNGGLIGLSLLIGAIVYTGSKIKRELLARGRLGSLFLPFLFAAVLYNVTEAMFGNLNLIWFMLSVAALHLPCASAKEATAVKGAAYGRG